MKPKVFLDTNILLDLFLERPGFEDASRILQAVCANKGGCSYIITRNVTHFHFTSLKEQARNISSFPPALSPEEFLATFN